MARWIIVIDAYIGSPLLIMHASNGIACSCAFRALKRIAVEAVKRCINAFVLGVIVREGKKCVSDVRTMAWQGKGVVEEELAGNEKIISNFISRSRRLTGMSLIKFTHFLFSCFLLIHHHSSLLLFLLSPFVVFQTQRTRFPFLPRGYYDRISYDTGLLIFLFLFLFFQRDER